MSDAQLFARLGLRPLARVRVYAIIQLAAFLLSLITDVWLFTLQLGVVFLDLTALHRFVEVVITLALVPLPMQTVALVYLRAGFRSFDWGGAAKFGRPTTLVTVYVASLVLILVTTLIAFSEITSYILPTSDFYSVSMGTSAMTLSMLSPFTSDLLLLFLLLLAGAITGLVGLIGGVVLGLWRVGQLYDSDKIRAGAILTFIPYINFIGTILVILGVSAVSKGPYWLSPAPTPDSTGAVTTDGEAVNKS